ncbi:Small integral membrane protein 5, partial [Phoenicopterus ruber ruber]
MSSEGFLKEMQTIGEKFLLKLQKLPKADPVEIVSFCVVLLFI